ncbi:hypothetical protein [Empedobacter sp. UBA7248]|uniref:hypothetical protein n=1 Tax=Empedobacter sp. UBA7248 TaxID=1946448 RepID=UPI0025BC249A|nr:hypothetical protein [Empedobacter sp. UBA7248]
MKKHIVLLSFLLSIISCYPGYNVYIINNTNSKIELQTYPSIEKRIGIKQGISYNKINSKKINGIDNFEEGIYNLNPNDSIFLFGNRGSLGNYLPFNSVKIKKYDTLEIKNSNLLDNINYKKGHKYYIVIR